MVKKKHPGKPLAQRLGTQIAVLRKTKEWTQADLAERIGVEPETISRFERGATTPSLQTLEKISHCLRVRIGELLAETSAQPDDQASKIAAWLAELDEPHRTFVVDQVKRTCDHLRNA
ncbi:helix-turn-helix domain-containing protein [Ottowia sp.]|uniref:helix-turn-helix domain-containing protein n=1 Tax=Ottowia sp. TaxID=1898956 RepID=UPI0039E2A000